MVEGERDDQDRDGGRPQDAADDEQVAAVAATLARRSLFPLLLPQRLQFPLGPGHCPSFSQTDEHVKRIRTVNPPSRSPATGRTRRSSGHWGCCRERRWRAAPARPLIFAVKVMTSVAPLNPPAGTTTGPHCAVAEPA